MQQTNICRNSRVGDKVTLVVGGVFHPIDFSSFAYRHSPLVSVLLSSQTMRSNAIDDHRVKKGNYNKYQIQGEIVEKSGFMESWKEVEVINGKDELLSENADNKVQSNLFWFKGKTIKSWLRLINNMSCKIVLIEEEIVDMGRGNSLGFSLFSRFLTTLASFREDIVGFFYQYLPSQHAGLALGVLFGIKSNIDQDFYEQLVKTGMLHVIAASGYNITIIINVMVMTLSKVVRKRFAVMFSIIGIVVYIFFAGGSASIVRAGIMGLIASLGIASGRVYSAKWALFFTIIVMLIVSPLFLLDIGFQLSVSATAGILWLEPIFSKFLKIKKANVIVTELKSSFITTLSASMLTLPLILIHFGRVSWISFLANSVLLWIIPYIMFFSMIFVSVGWIGKILAIPLSFLVWSSAELFILGVKTFSGFPFAQTEIMTNRWIFALLLYILIFFVYLRYRTKAKK